MVVQPLFRIAKPKMAGIWRAAARHNLRQSPPSRSTRFDPRKSHLNEVLVGPLESDRVVKLVATRLAVLTKKPRKDAVLCIEAIFSLPPDHTLDEGEYFRACVGWCVSWCGDEANIISAVLHRDEAAPHCHVLILPEIGGVLRGSDMVGGQSRLTGLHKSFARSVGQKFGLTPKPTLAEIFTSTGRRTSEDENPIGFAERRRGVTRQWTDSNPILCRVPGPSWPQAADDHHDGGANGKQVTNVGRAPLRIDLSDLVIPTFNDWVRAHFGSATERDPALPRRSAMQAFSMMAATLTHPRVRRST